VRAHPNGATKLTFNEALKRVFNGFATDLIENTHRAIDRSGVRTVEDVRSQPSRLAGFSPAVAEQNTLLKRFLSAKIYSHEAIVEDRNRSVEALDALFQLFLDHPERMPEPYANQAEQTPRARVVCDYIAGMTDHFLLRQWRELLTPGAPRAGEATAS